MTSPFESPTPISYKWSIDNIRLSSSVQKFLTHFETPFGEFSLIRAALFELWMTKIALAVQQLFDSTFRLEIPNPAPGLGSFGA
jgi:hypothetical protein